MRSISTRDPVKASEACCAVRKDASTSGQGLHPLFPRPRFLPLTQSAAIRSPPDFPASKRKRGPQLRARDRRA